MEDTLVKVRRFSNLNELRLSDLPAYRYVLINPSESPTCIYKAIPGIEKVARFVARINNWNRTPSLDIDLWLLDDDGMIRSATGGPIELDLPKFTMLFDPRDKRTSSHVIRIVEGSTDFDVDLLGSFIEKMPIKETAFGDFYVDVFGWRIDVPKFLASGKLVDSLRSFFEISGKWQDQEQISRYLGPILMPPIKPDPKAGITKALLALEKFYQAEKSSSSKIAYRVLVDAAKRTIGGLKISVCFNSIFSQVTTQEQFSEKCSELSKLLFMGGRQYYWTADQFLTKVVDSDSLKDVKKSAIKRRQTGAFNKIMADLDFIEIDRDKYPKTHEAVYNGDIPVGTFFRKTGETYFAYNDSWDLWEEMLTYHHDIAIQIAKEASSRSTYEKDLLSYFQFTLHTLPEYLAKHTGKPWTGIPKVVKSANELEPPSEDRPGTTKTRSALTPIVDNENNTVTVPYVTMSVYGRNTTYCYGLDFNVLRRGFSFEGSAVTKDVEEKLNGRDDYGLMFYTLTGSDSNTGYPTFLIIFERLHDSTRVHFHRTHSMRSKQGENNPVHNWTRSGYKWMVGNVAFDRIKAQQGDLAFVEIDKVPDPDPDRKTTAFDPNDENYIDPRPRYVNSYDSHTFGEKVLFFPYLKKDKQNVLGYVTLPHAVGLTHKEHMARAIPAGTYEIRQCKSWEANPRGIWSYRID